MSQHLTATAICVTIALGAALVSAALTYRWTRADFQQRIEQAGNRGRKDGYRHAYETSIHDGRRVEIRVSDWTGAVHDPAMSFRWTLWDADRVQRLLAEGAEAPVEGIEVPYHLGNAPTRPLAEAEALAWIKTHAPESHVVVRP
jgi:hypothetical protein